MQTTDYNFNIPRDISEIVRISLKEDIETGDITGQLIPKAKVIKAKIISKDLGIFCGGPWAEEVIQQLDDAIELTWLVKEGSNVKPQEQLASLSGSARNILTAERTLLNFLQTLSATATTSNHYSRLVAHTKVQLLDTRKTLPGLRSAQKYAVRVGGCYNHRMGLYDGYLIKENHISAFGSVSAAIAQGQLNNPGKSIEIEIQALDELEEAIQAGADIIMLDNFKLSNIVSAIELNAGRSKLEASGGIDKDSLVKIAETGVDYISIGALTKDCQAFDLSLLVI
jgi:nicotinate-nucleotide pyrophosphorylase (carboxylating)|tara:strand:- start:36 stop:884 length:849 start_codon:yes stop_codon:yes gene_type:complete